jgi:hypothetical protein
MGFLNFLFLFLKMFLIFKQRCLKPCDIYLFLNFKYDYDTTFMNDLNIKCLGLFNNRQVLILF